ncbi:hypothetical protein DCC79_05425 [bacterium]|nr:MAG: hypothetical protein DCC79_05425 [bacterium]
MSPAGPQRADAGASGVVPAQVAARWSFPAVIHDDPSGAFQGAPALAVDGAGGMWAVWVDDRLGTPGAAFFTARRPAGAAAWQPDARVMLRDGRGRRADPAIVVDADGGVHVVWAETHGADADIYHSRLEVGSKVWTAAEAVGDDPGGAQQASPRLAADPYGNIHMVWVDDRHGTLDILHSRRLPDGTWSPPSRVNNPADGDQRDPALAATKHGDLIAVWQDVRAGRGDIYASRLPPGGLVWWPNGRLNASTDRQLQRAPAVAADSRGRAHALWIDDAEQVLRIATLPDPNGFWDRDRVLYAARRGTLLSATVAGGPGGQVVAAWAETRPDGSRIYAGVVPPDGEPVAAARVDASPLVSRSRAPAAVIDTGARAHVVWEAETAAGGADVLASTRALDVPPYPAAAVEGWLEYVPRGPSCAADGFVTRLCDGLPGPFIAARGVDLVPYLGSYVHVSGVRVDDTACAAVVPTEVAFKAAPCPRDTAAITGLLTDGGVPVEGAVVSAGDAVATSGSSGRYFLQGLTPGKRYVVTATLPCALPAAYGPFRALRGLNALPTGAFTRGEVIDDCAIDVFDLVRTAIQVKADGPFLPACSDVDQDGAVGIRDLAIIAANYGSTCPAPWRPPTPAAAPALVRAGRSLPDMLTGPAWRRAGRP